MWGMDTTNFKNPFSSLTIWGCVTALVAGFDQLYQAVDQLPAGILPPQLKVIMQIAGPIIGIVGRFKATKGIKI